MKRQTGDIMRIAVIRCSTGAIAAGGIVPRKPQTESLCHALGHDDPTIVLPRRAIPVCADSKRNQGL